jgi:hypothetical protein
MLGGQVVGAVRSDFEHRAQCQPDVVDARGPAVSIVLGDLEPAAAGWQRIQ